MDAAMTTKYNYKYYNVETHQHQGTFPDLYWESEYVPLYGCEKVSVALRIYPTGDNAKNRGYVSAFLYFKCEDPTASLEYNYSMNVSGKTTKQRQANGVTVEDGGDTEFGAGWGFGKHCAMDSVFQAKQVELEYSVTVVQFTQKAGDNTVITRPVGEQEICATSKV